MFRKEKIDDFVTALSGSDPVPGGGGVCALCGALGTALGNMVASLTVGKKKYADVEDEIKVLSEQKKTEEWTAASFRILQILMLHSAAKRENSIADTAQTLLNQLVKKAV